MRVIVLLFIFVLNAAFCYAQSAARNRIDSLRTAFKQTRDDSARSRLLSNISEEYSYFNTDSAALYVLEAKKIAAQLPFDLLNVHLAIQHAILFYEKGLYDSSILELKHIQPVAEKLNNKAYFLKLYQTYGNSYGLSNDHQQAIANELKALDYAKMLKDSMAMANLYINIGSDFHYIKEYKKAIEYCRNALNLYQQLNQNFHQGYALNNLANYSNRLGNYDQALLHASAATTFWNEKQHERLMPYLYHNFGEAYKGLNKYDKAETYYGKAIRIREKHGDVKDLSITRNALADLYLKWSRTDQALALAKENVSFTGNMGFKLERKEAASLLASAFEKKSDFKNAVAYMKLSQSLNDSLHAEEQAKEVLRLQTRYETAEKENQILLQKNKIAENELYIKSRNQWIIGLAGLVLVIGLAGFLLYYRQKIKIRQQRKEAELKLALHTIENQRKLQEQRLAISRDLHDNIGSHLTFIISSIDTSTYFLKETNQKVAERLSGISRFTRETITELRDTIWAMNKGQISIEDLKARIFNFINNANQSLEGVDFHFDDSAMIGHDILFDSKTGMNIFRIIQEAVNNAIKHAGARRISVNTAESTAAITFTISDDGRGFGNNIPTDGNGLQTMRKRAGELNARFEMNTGEQGTTIQFTIQHPIQDHGKNV